MAAIEARDREGWLALFTEDAVVEDPIGPSMFDPEGLGHRGKDAIGKFFDNVIAPNDKIKFTIGSPTSAAPRWPTSGRSTSPCRAGTDRERRPGLYLPRRPDGGLEALRAYWEVEQMQCSR